jgi:AcrR family transcriptional regulator
MPAARQKGDVRERILAVATRQFAQRGFEAASLDDIASEVGIRKQSLLYHFASKDELRRGVHQKLLDHWNGLLPRLLQAATSGEEQFEAVVTELVAFFTADPDRARLVVREVLDRPDEVIGLMRTQVRPWVDIVCNYIKKGQAQGLIWPEVDPEAYVVQVINLVVASVATHHCIGGLLPESRRGAVPRRHIDELVRVARASLFRPVELRPARARNRAR